MEFKNDLYVVNDKNEPQVPEIVINYPDEYLAAKIFPINITVDEIDINTTSKSLLNY